MEQFDGAKWSIDGVRLDDLKGKIEEELLLMNEKVQKKWEGNYE